MTVAPFALARVAGLRYEAIAALTPPRVHALLDTFSAGRARCERLRASVEDALFALAATDDRALRRDALACKRDVHNRRAIRAGVLEHVAGRLDPTAAAALREWSAACGSSTEAARHLEAELDHEVRAHLRPRLAEVTRVPAFARALALASPDLARDLLERDVVPQQLGSTKRERSVFAYVIRAAAKTSPFSSFCLTGLVRFGPAAGTQRLEPAAAISRCYVNRGHVATCTAELARTGAAPLAVSRDVRWLEDGAIESVAPRWVEVGRRLWRIGSPRRVRVHDALRTFLQTRPTVTLDVLVRAGLEEAAALRLLGHLVETGVLVAAVTVDAFTASPAVAVASALPDAVAAPFRAAEEAAAALGDCDAAGRLAIVERVHPRANALLEDCVFAEPIDAPPAAIAPIAADLAAALAPHVAERADHARLRAAFIARFGESGVCRDLAGFFAALKDSVGPAPDLEPNNRAPVPVAVLAQIERGDDGLARAVINQLHSAGGPMFARWAAGTDATAVALRSAARAWIARVAGGRRSLDVLVSGDCNPLQAHPRLTDAVLALPGEPCADPEALRLESLLLAVDKTGALTVRTVDAEPLFPVYLGGTVLSEMSGPAYWLGVIACPYEVRRPHADIAPPEVPTEVDVVSRPRRTHGSVVLQRASTWVRVARLRARWFARSGARRLLDVAEELAAIGISQRFFARRALGDGDSKPLWVDARNPFCLDLLERYVDGAQWIAFVELLPDPARAWPPSTDGPRATELLLEVLV